jgi:hypothetical protein
VASFVSDLGTKGLAKSLQWQFSSKGVRIMKTLTIAALLAPLAMAVALPASAQETRVVIKHRSGHGHSDFGHEQWRHGRAWGHHHEMTTGTVHKKVIIRHGMGGTTKTVVKTHSDD